jgi:hypothetical protein
MRRRARRQHGPGAPSHRLAGLGPGFSVLTAADVDLLTLGSGPRVVLVHGSIVDARRTWRRQFELAERFTLVVADTGAPYNARLEAFLRA